MERFVRLKISKVKIVVIVGVLLGVLLIAVHAPRDNLLRMTYKGQTSDSTAWPVHFQGVGNKIQKLPEALIIGNKKGGTRALSEMIRLNTAVVSKDEDTHFFDKDENYDRGLSWYVKQMPYVFPDQMTIEKTPAYFFTSKVPRRIYDYNPRIKMLLILKDPSSRALSEHTHDSLDHEKRNLPPLPAFESMVMKGGEIDLTYQAVNRSTYYYHMKNWLKYFPLESIHIVDGGELVKDPVSELKKVEKFLNLPSMISAANFHFNTTKGFFCMIKDGKEKCLNNSKGRVHPQVDPAVMDKLIQFYHEPNMKFFELVGRTFNWR